MGRPLLIDALHIHESGALMILNHLVRRLVERHVDFCLLKDSRSPQLWEERKVPKVMVSACDEFSRLRFYLRHRDEYRAVLCLANVPPPVRLRCPVYTYIHNVSLLAIPADYPPVWKFKSWLKRIYIRFQSRNTDCWMVQTANTEQLVNCAINSRKLPVWQYPFFQDLPKQSEECQAVRTDYLFIGDDTNAKGHTYLIEAWGKLARRGVTPTLHLTVTSARLQPLIEEARQLGANIVNHGCIPFEEVVSLYRRSKATVYPSLNESLGLGLIEALQAGCDVIGCDLPYVHCVCTPSYVFAPQSPDSIVEAVLRYEAAPQPSVLTIVDRTDALISVLGTV